MENRPRTRVLLADNSPEYRRSLSGILQLESFDVEEAGTPKEAQQRLKNAQIDLALIDIRMQDDDDPRDVSGLEVAKFASERGIPSIIVTAFPSVELARSALRSRGAEPYATDLITKASTPQALLDSISLTLEHLGNQRLQSQKGGFFIDLERKLVWKHGKLISLTLNQYRLLEELYKKRGGVSTPTELIKAIYGEVIPDKQASNDRRLTNLVARTKAKIEETNSTHEYLEIVPGRGFRLNFGFAGDPTTDAPPPPKKEK